MSSTRAHEKRRPTTLTAPPVLSRQPPSGATSLFAKHDASPPAAANEQSSGAGTGAAIDAVVGGPGRPLDAETRGFMEPRFGHDFGKVRVHADDDASRSARAIGARAYTVGNHIVFGVGEHAPSSAGGRQLLAHELAHVVQQRAVPQGAMLQRQQAPIAAATWGSGRKSVPQGSGGAAGEAKTSTFVIRAPITVRIQGTATGMSGNTSNWSITLMRDTWFGADEQVGTRTIGTCPGSIDFRVSVPQSWSASYYLLFRNAAQYNGIDVSWSVD